MRHVGAHVGGMRRMKRSRKRVQVLISHASQDDWVARQIAFHVKRCGATPFLDVLDLEQGDDYDAKLMKATRESRELIVLFTPAASRSKNVWMEMGSFWGQGKRIVCVLYGFTIAQLLKDKQVPMAVKKLQLVEIDDIDKYFRQLRRRVKKAGCSR